MDRRAWRSGGPLDTLLGAAIAVMVVSAVVALLVRWPVQCLSAVGAAAAVAGVAAVVAWWDGRADARRREQTALAAPRQAGPPPLERDPAADAAAAMRAAGFPESVVASWLADPPAGGVDQQAPAPG